MALQVPDEPATSQASHWPSHARSQHTPSVQKPEPHSRLLVHDVPASFEQVPFLFAAHDEPASHPIEEQHTPSVQKAPEGQVEASEQGSPSFEVATGTQTFDVQVKPVVQSALVAQLDLQAVAPQT